MRHKKNSNKPKKPVPSKQKKRRSSRLSMIIAAGVLLAALPVYFLISYFFSKPAFNGERAFEYLKTQCDFGPRNPGSQGHQKCGDFLVRELEKYGDKVWQQKFSYTDKEDTSRVYEGRNIIASFNLNPRKNFRVMLCAHWDTRPYADKDSDTLNHRQPVLGANDGASGVAVLLEMARILHQSQPDFGVEIIFFDLEDLGAYNASAYPDSLNQFCIGSEYFAANNHTYRPRYGILLDMVGDKELVIKKEGFSQANAPALVDRVWAAAKKVGAAAFVDEAGDPLQDDHYPFLKRGIRVIDLIDFDYPYWHTIEDTPDKCSVESLQQIGEVLVEVLYGKEE